MSRIKNGPFLILQSRHREFPLLRKTVNKINIILQDYELFRPHISSIS